MELLVVIAVIGVIAAVSYPAFRTYLNDYRIAGDAKRIASEIALARMRSASDFNQAQFSIDTNAQTFQINMCNKGSGQFSSSDPALPLSAGVTFGFGSITTPVNPTYQTTIAQTAPITFNSRGIPISTTGCSSGSAPTITGNNVVYLSGTGGLHYAVTVNITGKIDVWSYSNSGWAKSGY